MISSCRLRLAAFITELEALTVVLPTGATAVAAPVADEEVAGGVGVVTALIDATENDELDEPMCEPISL